MKFKGITVNIRWKSIWASFIEDNAGKFSDQELTCELNDRFDTRFIPYAVTRKRQRLKIKKQGVQHRIELL